MTGERPLVAGIIQLANLLMRHLGPLFEKSSITPQQWAVLAAIEDGPVNLATVARRLAVSKQNMTGMMSRLEQLGLIERFENPHDLRSSRLQLSRRGRGLIERLTPAYEQWQRELGREIPERELQVLTRVINRLIARLER